MKLALYKYVIIIIIIIIIIITIIIIIIIIIIDKSITIFRRPIRTVLSCYALVYLYEIFVWIHAVN